MGVINSSTYKPLPGLPDYPHDRRSSWIPLAGVSNLLVSLGHTGRRVVLGHPLNTLQHVITKKKSHNVLSNLWFCVGPHSPPSWAACAPRARGWTPPLDLYIQNKGRWKLWCLLWPDSAVECSLSTLSATSVSTIQCGRSLRRTVCFESKGELGGQFRSCLPGGTI